MLNDAFDREDDLMPPSEKLFDDAETESADLTREYSDRLTGDQLTAEFRSPLTRSNRQRKLRAQSRGATLWQDPEQERMF